MPARQVVAPPLTSSNWPPIIPSVARSARGRRRAGSRKPELPAPAARSASPVPGSPSPRRTARARSRGRGGSHRRRARAGRRERGPNVCTSSTAAAAGRSSSGREPVASPQARQSTGRIRLPPPSRAVAHRLRQGAELFCERKPGEVVLDQRAVLVEARHLLAGLAPACSSSDSTCFAISASSPRMSIAASGSGGLLEPDTGALEPLEQLFGRG